MLLNGRDQRMFFLVRQVVRWHHLLRDSFHRAAGITRDLLRRERPGEIAFDTDELPVDGGGT
ncbi:MAG: hypothetical protein M3R24_33205 [Chloroflexota bacterium]|nr:hypothetical protein [Chloroflexota bacterium]